MKPFADKVVVITGGAGGIGFAVAQRFGQDGAHLVLLDRDAEATRARVEQLRASGLHAGGRACDITDEVVCRQTIEELIGELGGIDVLVHSAGLTQVSAADETDLSVYRRVMDVNFFGAVTVTRAALASLQQRQGRIAVLSSIAGVGPLLGRTGYCASKYALHGYFETLRCELAPPNVSVTMVCPSFVATDFARRGLAGDGSVLVSDRDTAGRMVSPEQVADAIYRGVARRKRIVIMGGTGRLAYWLARFAPRLYERQMMRRFRRQIQVADAKQT